MRTPAEGAGARDHAGGEDHGEHNRPDTQTQGEKPTYAPIPARALADIRLSALDLRVLATIAAHDRFGKNGIGCYASHPRLAGIVNCQLKSLSRCLRRLGEFGYIEAERHPVMKRLRVYRVAYMSEDKAALKKPIGNETVTNDEAETGNETVTEDAPIGNQPVPEHASIGNRGGYPKEIELSSEEIARSAEESSAEAAPGGAPAMKEEQRSDVVPTHARELQDAGMALRKVEAAFKTTEGRHFTKGEVDYFSHHADRCAEIEDRWLGGSPDEERIGYWAQRLALEITDKLADWQDARDRDHGHDLQPAPNETPASHSDDWRDRVQHKDALDPEAWG